LVAGVVPDDDDDELLFAIALQYTQTGNRKTLEKGPQTEANDILGWRLT
jgi:hypothetical protein